MKRLAFVLAVALTLSACGEDGIGNDRSPLATEGVTDSMIAAGVGDEWLSYGGGYDEQRFSPLDQVNAENVSNLGLAWFADMDTGRGQEATPLMHDGTLYVSTAWSMVKAYDAKRAHPNGALTQRFRATHWCGYAAMQLIAVWRFMATRSSLLR